MMMRKIPSIVICLIMLCSSCRTSVETDKKLTNLKKEFGGEWSLQDLDECTLLIVTNSERINNSPDSIEQFLFRVDKISEEIIKSPCLQLEIARKSGNFDSSSSSSVTYQVRP